VSGRILIELAFQFAGVPEALVYKRFQARLGARALDGGDEGLPSHLHLLVRRQARPVDQPLGVDERQLVE
jgi:hypothetical protein